jgi:hypothetical protein
MEMADVWRVGFNKIGSPMSSRPFTTREAAEGFIKKNYRKKGHSCSKRPYKCGS